MRKIKNKKKKILIISTIVFIITLIIIASLYIAKKEVRDWVDINILRKNISEEDTQLIHLNTDKSNQIHVYGDYIALLNDKKVTLYNSFGEKVTLLDVDINKGLFDSSSKYFAIAEENGQELCLILDKTYLWSEKIEGQILQIHVNKNGYVAVISTDVANKSILTMFNSEGKKLFTSYFATTRIVDVSISYDNKNIAIAELDTSGTLLQSNIKIISLENAQNDTANTIVYKYNAEQGDLITNVEYQDKGQISAVYDSGLKVINNQECKDILKINNDNITYISNNLKNYATYVEEKSTGLFKAESDVHIINLTDNKEVVYNLKEIAKEIYTNNNVIAVNAGTELYFINTSGWLIKKYTAKQEITNVKFSDNLATIIYKDKIVIIDL